MILLGSFRVSTKQIATCSLRSHHFVIELVFGGLNTTVAVHFILFPMSSDHTGQRRLRQHNRHQAVASNRCHTNKHYKSHDDTNDQHDLILIDTLLLHIGDLLHDSAVCAHLGRFIFLGHVAD